MQETIIHEPILFIGDIHGYFQTLMDLLDKNDISNCTLICVGDFGVGFNYSFEAEINTLRDLNQYFKSKNIKFLTIRGNHDDPRYFKGGYYNFSNLEFIPDYTIKNINDSKFLFVGGAVSIDRRMRTEGLSYWKDELFVLNEELVEECDILVTHSAPSWIGPFEKKGIEGWLNRDVDLWEICLQERKDHDRLFKLAKPKRSYHGHFHKHYVCDFDNCVATILEEFGLAELPQY